MLKKLKKAFTITELVIVIAVIAILAAVLIPTFSNVVENAHKSSALQTSKNALTDYLAIVGTDDEPDNDNPSGIVFVNEGYVHVYLNSALHYVGELDDLQTMNASGEYSTGTDTTLYTNITLPGTDLETTDATAHIKITSKDTNSGNPLLIYAKAQADGTAGLALETAPEAAEEGYITKKTETVYFYSVEVNETPYYGFFTLETIKDAKFQIESCVYSRLSGVTKQGFTVANVATGA